MTLFNRGTYHWRIQGGGCCWRAPPQQDPFLSFSHTFSSKSVCIRGQRPPRPMGRRPQQEILDPPLHIISYYLYWNIVQLGAQRTHFSLFDHSVAFRPLIRLFMSLHYTLDYQLINITFSYKKKSAKDTHTF